MARPAGSAPPTPPPIVGGSHDPLLEWALREAGCGLAILPEGSEAGLRASARRGGRRGHPSAPARRDERPPISTRSRRAPGLHDAVLIGFARREQGLLVAPGNPLGLTRHAPRRPSARARFALRPQGAGAQLLLMALLQSRRPGIDGRAAALEPPCPTGPDVAQAIRAGRADCGIATRAVADRRRPRLRAARLGALRPGAAPARLFPRRGRRRCSRFVRTAAFAERARELQGYDVTEVGGVRLVN